MTDTSWLNNENKIREITYKKFLHGYGFIDKKNGKIIDYFKIGYDTKKNKYYDVESINYNERNN